MKKLQYLFKQNVQWSESVKKIQGDDFFIKLSGSQNPKYLWIGCSDSRVPANELIGLYPGEVFVHRNIANLIHAADINCQSVIEYAIHTLKVEHAIVCGHYGCGGVLAAMGQDNDGLIDHWIWTIRRTYKKHDKLLSLLDEKQKYRALCELNVIEQVIRVAECKPVRSAWSNGRNLTIHGWIYGVDNGLLKDLNMCVTIDDDPDAMYKVAIQEVQDRYLNQNQMI